MFFIYYLRPPKVASLAHTSAIRFSAKRICHSTNSRPVLSPRGVASRSRRYCAS